MSLLEYNTRKKRQVDKKIVEKLKFESDSNNKEFKVENIYDNAIYTKKLEVDHLLGLYNLVSWKSYPKDENNQESTSVVQYL